MSTDSGALMAKRKAAAKGKPEVGTRAVAFRAMPDYVEWLERAARHDRASVATFLDRAATERAKAIGFNDPAPERLP